MSAGRLTLADGASVDVVPMTPELAPALLRFHATLTPRTTRNRFFAVHPNLSPAEVTRFTHVDHVAREAIVAMDGDELVAVARFDRLPAQPTTAEVAFVVADAWQGRGLATALLGHLVGRARDLGVECFVAETLPSNGAMRAVFRHAGFPVHETVGRDAVRVTIDLSG